MGSATHDVAKLSSMLRTAPHGGVELDVLNELDVLAADGNLQAVDVLVAHATGHRGVHRDHAASLLTSLAGAGRKNGRKRKPLALSQWPQLFDHLLRFEQARYWAIPGLLSSAGVDAYPKVMGIALNDGERLAIRAQAVKSLAMASGQRFDRDLPSDPGHWRLPDLRLDELRAWAASGCPRGPGYPAPLRDPGLDAPSTSLEKLAARLDQRLTAERASAIYEDDPACPTQRLVPARLEDLTALHRLWRLPTVYREFLARFSPLRVVVSSEEYSGLALYGASELIERQAGYAWYPDPAVPLPEWPAGYVVIADHGADPFVLDLSASNGQDAPVLTAMHGMGTWDFETYSPSFVDFIEALIRSA